MEAMASERDHLTSRSAEELVAMLQTGEVTAEAVVDAHLGVIDAVNPQLNAVVVSRADQARTEAAAADMGRREGRPLGSLHGLPVTIKEQFLLVGTATTFGFLWRRDHRADHTGPLVRALQDAGAIVLGKTNVGQTMIFHEADNRLYGRTRNPWNLDRTPGGSSGGESAIIAAGGSPLGLGGDLGGSVRVPAHFTGLASIKPTAGRLTRADTPNDIANPPPELPFQPGPLARRVGDLRLAMTVLAAASVGAADAAGDAPPYPTNRPSIEGSRVAIQVDESYFRTSPAIRRALSEAAADLKTAGATVVTFAPPPVSEAVRLFLGVMAADGGAWLQASLHGESPDPRAAGLIKAGAIPEPIRPIAAAFLRASGQRWLGRTVSLARRRSGAAFERLLADLVAYQDAYLRAMDTARVDLVISPPHALPALRHGASELLDVTNAASWAILYNVLGLPAGVVPVTTVQPDEETDRPGSRDPVERAALATELGSAGLPVGVQVAARRWREDLVLEGMAAIERAVDVRGGLPAVPSL
jgi:fatty acid amide hydrolase